MALSTAARNLMLDALAQVAAYVSLHTSDPGAAGANEVEGGSYARQPITWNPAASGNLDDDNQPEFDIPPNTTISHFGLWSAEEGGTYYGSGALSASESYGASGGTYTLTDVDVSLT